MSKIRILSILDEFTYTNLKLEEHVELISRKPFWYRKSNKIDFLLVESAWRGNRDQWRHQIATYPEHQDRNTKKLKVLVDWCKDHAIPTVFWNKEDPYHYDQFIEAASFFDYVLTTDQMSLTRYNTDAPNSKASIATFFIQPKLHFHDTQPALKRSLFMGTYQRDMHDERTAWQNMVFQAAAPYGLDLVNRHNKNIENYAFPKFAGDIHYFPPVRYKDTATLYRRYQQTLNVNTITQSPTMFSRRLIEIMGCGRLAISNPSESISKLFPDMCVELINNAQAEELFAQLQYGYTQQQSEMVKYAHLHVHQHYTAKIWLKQLLQTIQLDHAYLAS